MRHGLLTIRLVQAQHHPDELDPWTIPHTPVTLSPGYRTVAIPIMEPTTTSTATSTTITSPRSSSSSMPDLWKAYPVMISRMLPLHDAPPRSAMGARWTVRPSPLHPEPPPDMGPRCCLPPPHTGGLSVRLPHVWQVGPGRLQHHHSPWRPTKKPSVMWTSSSSKTSWGCAYIMIA